MGNKLSIAAVQFKWKIEYYKNRLSFQSRINSVMDQIRSKADDNIPLLVVFPEDIGTPFLLFNSYDDIKDKKNFAQAVQSLVMSDLMGVLKYKLKFGISFVRALILSKSIDMDKEYRFIFSTTAKKYNAYIVAGSITLPDILIGKSARPARDVHNISYFFGPDGNIIGKQKKIHLVDFEGRDGFDLTSGSLNDLKVFKTPFGRIGITICLDGFKEDVLDVLHDGKADILIQPSANNGPWSEWQQTDWLNGSYLAVYKRKKFKYAVNPMMNGNIFDLGFEGQSSIISSTGTGFKTNFKLLKPEEGFIAVAQDHNTEEILISEIEI